MEELRFRQVHLDFHTSEHIADIGKFFDKQNFQEALKKGHIDSITLFSKCHHGWSYHPTAVNRMHPHLKFDLLGEQLKAAAEIGVKTPVYLSAGLDEKEAVTHPEWLVRKEDDSADSLADFVRNPGYHLLCYNTPYLELLLKQIEEVMERYQPCGIFLDISSVHPCYCMQCRKDILNRGKDPRDIEAVMEQAELVYQNYAKKVEETVRRYSDTCTIFHNGGHIAKGRRDLANCNTHLELESLPTGGWGYEHFPMSASYVTNLGMQYLGMTGKFHNSWGEFGGFKHPNALRYETALSLAFGAKCSIGDQLHPLGSMNPVTYDLIGAAYKEVEQKEAWCKGTESCADIAVLSEEAVNSRVSNKDTYFGGDIGANRILLEGNYLFHFIDREEDFTKYKLIILPDTIRLDEDLQRRLDAYRNEGGKILASGVSGLKEDAQIFGLDFGADFAGRNEYCPDYAVWKDEGGNESARVMNAQGYLIENIRGKVFLYRENPYFNRDIRHFCSHQHTPNDESRRLPAGVLNDSVAYIGWDIFRDYAITGRLHDKQIVIAAIESLMGEDKMMAVSLPDRGVVTVRKQEKEKRYVVHFLFAHTTIRGESMQGDKAYSIEAIEDIVPLYEIDVKMRVKEKIKRVYMAPQGTELEFRMEENRLVFQVPKLECHQMVALEYA